MRVLWAHPARAVTAAFLVVFLIGTALLLLPASRAEGAPADLMVASFTTVSALCVTGLITVDTATYWTPFGQVVIMLLIQVGGIGVMTLATLLALAVRGRLGLRSSLAAQMDTHSSGLGQVRQVVGRIVVLALAIEAVVAVLLTLRLALGHGMAWPRAAWHGVFHAVSAFNNAGFALYSDNLIGFVGDIWFIGPVCVALVMGGLGFPVLRELLLRKRPSRWSVHTRLTLGGSAVLLVLGVVLFGLFETGSRGTLAALPPHEQLVGAIGGGVFPRTAGFNAVDYAQVTEETEAITMVLMFIGGGSAGTAGGIKVTTFLLLAAVIWAEVRGEPDVVIGHRRIGGAVQRQALTVALLAVGLVILSTILLMMLTDLPSLDLGFEVVSAFATVGLSTGITAQLPPAGQLILMALMFLGRLGPITVASAIAVNTRHRHYRLPEERPIVG
ncbi:TrkH family potassium uptake protein [Ornithinimicrobium cerasi]|uniref:Potassium uptake protein, TrkH family n=1 Tax=Ornithinimicrobium cerasi TaxID=2248773 RepID=A0A285VHG8_9MICO|nr:potassium transporter TrkG [Ornithinimicrobium cerasi]SOC53529.1 potassium uptake protein, TrkH family [Ornithinimicrobium cerasi]